MISTYQTSFPLDNAPNLPLLGNDVLSNDLLDLLQPQSVHPNDLHRIYENLSAVHPSSSLGDMAVDADPLVMGEGLILHDPYNLPLPFPDSNLNNDFYNLLQPHPVAPFNPVNPDVSYDAFSKPFIWGCTQISGADTCGQAAAHQSCLDQNHCPAYQAAAQLVTCHRQLPIFLAMDPAVDDLILHYLSYQYIHNTNDEYSHNNITQDLSGFT
ncbi:hypothetical protein BT96DRAFT_948888 [Gymnopus androsaceus JB14]|uniref:Uncharacterized protein n=1 Tax=Gymnopus androsaceus JB14 TaxID=1447944 RepID=A0A6A4GME4_9AGAR|nr:hypothetical protein BT96DRAFT_948888 [Gymnopus androsaceus JB14]